MTALAYFDDLPPAPPLLDHAAVEQARLVRLARDHIAGTEPSVDYEGLATGRSCTVLAARQWVKRARAKGSLFVVEHGGRTLIPTFQLDEAFDLDHQASKATQRLVEYGLSGWAIWQWYSAINPWTQTRPVDTLGSGELGKAVDGLVGC